MLTGKSSISIILTGSLVFLLFFGGLGCDVGTVTMNLLVYDAETDLYQFKDVDVTTLTNVSRLEGDATKLYGGASLTLNYARNYLEWDYDGHSVAFTAIEEDGVLIPEDYDSLAMASIYYHIEQSLRFFLERTDLMPEDLTDLPTYYWADLTIVETDGDKNKMLDNAFYMYMEEDRQAFFIVPFYQFQWIPMPLNAGVITHEYSHAVFDRIVLGLKDIVPVSDLGTNFLYGINEGIADFLAVARTGDPAFIRHSIPKGIFQIECNYTGYQQDVVRDASQPMGYTVDVDNPARYFAPLEFCPYDVGSFLSALLYEFASKLDGDGESAPTSSELGLVAEWLLDALVELGYQLPFDFELYHLLALFFEQIDSPGARDTFCGIVDYRDKTTASILFSELPEC